MKLAVAVAFLALAMLPARASENRCGWLVNPTPGNWWLTDRDGTWTLATQGMEASDDLMLNLPEFDGLVIPLGVGVFYAIGKGDVPMLDLGATFDWPLYLATEAVDTLNLDIFTIGLAARFHLFL